MPGISSVTFTAEPKYPEPIPTSGSVVVDPPQKDPISIELAVEFEIETTRFDSGPGHAWFGNIDIYGVDPGPGEKDELTHILAMPIEPVKGQPPQTFFSVASGKRRYAVGVMPSDVNEDPGESEGRFVLDGELFVPGFGPVIDVTGLVGPNRYPIPNGPIPNGPPGPFFPRSSGYIRVLGHWVRPEARDDELIAVVSLKYINLNGVMRGVIEAHSNIATITV